MPDSKLPKSKPHVSQVADNSGRPVAAAPETPPGFRCPAPGCQERHSVRRFCAVHRAARLAQRYHTPEPPDAVFACIVPGCAAVVPHREFLCEAHWGQVKPKRRSKIKHFAQLYRIHLGRALAELAEDGRTEREREEPETAAAIQGTAISG